MKVFFKQFFKIIHYNKQLTPIYKCFVVAICLFSVFKVQAQSSLPTLPATTLKVGVAGTAPFVIVENGQAYSGIAIEIWEAIAARANLQYSYVPFKTVHDAVEAVEQGKVDAVVGPVSITSDRTRHARFSQPFYQSSLAIVSRLDEPGFWDRIKPFFSLKLLIATGIFVTILVMVGALLWMAEHKRSPEQFPNDPVNGIANGMWLAIVTMSTTGYGDKAPITFWGRIIAGAWMVISLIFATSMVAGIASTLTLTGLSNDTIATVEQLSGKKAATIGGSATEAFLADENVKEVPVQNLNEAFTHLLNRKVDAVVYDRPQLLYYLSKHKQDKLYLSKAEYYRQGYGFLFPLNSNIVHKINIELLALSESNKTERIFAYWLGKKSER